MGIVLRHTGCSARRRSGNRAISDDSAMIPLWLFQDAQTPFLGDPRQALAHVLRRYAELGLEPVVATELEFYLVDPDPPRHRIRVEPRTPTLTPSP